MKSHRMTNTFCINPVYFIPFIVGKKEDIFRDIVSEKEKFSQYLMYNIRKARKKF